jgi:hypothetical protein
MILTERDRTLLKTLALYVRALTLEQVSRTWWQDSSSDAALTRLLQLERANLVESQFVMAHAELPLNSPRCSWLPGNSQPPFGPIAYELQRRWTEAVRRTRIFVATKRAGNQFGGFGGRLMRPLQATHDLHVAAIFLLRRKQFGENGGGWLLEDSIAHERRRQKLPDAVVRSGCSELVIEFGGSYRKERLIRVHEDCAKRNLSYEIW